MAFPRRLSDFDEADYAHYRETTVDPGPTLFLAAVAICVGLLLSVPLCVKVGRRWRRKKVFRDILDGKGTHGKGSGDWDGAYHAYNDGPDPPRDSAMSINQRCQRVLVWALQFVLEKGIRRRKRKRGNAELWRKRVSSNGEWEVHNAPFLAGDRRLHVRPSNGAVELVWNSHLSDSSDQSSDRAVGLVPSSDRCGGDEAKAPSAKPDRGGGSYRPPSVPPPSEYYDAAQKQLELETFELEQYSYEKRTNGSDAHPVFLCFTWKNFVRIDYESRQIFRLVGPFTLSAICSTISELFIVSLISHKLGTDSLVALIMVDTVVGISSTFTYCWIEATSSLCSMAYGAENYEAIGQYLKTSCVLYVLSEIPFAFMWFKYLGSILLWMGFDESAADLAHSFVWFQVAINVIEGLSECLLDFLGVIGKAGYANSVYCIGCVADVVLVALLAAKTEATLTVFGIGWLALEAVFLAFNIAISKGMGWLDDFHLESFCNCELNTTILKQLFKTALPLCVGGVIAFAEWECLIVFAAVLGPAEAATWQVNLFAEFILQPFLPLIVLRPRFFFPQDPPWLCLGVSVQFLLCILHSSSHLCN